MNKDWVDSMTGLVPNIQTIAFKYLLKGLGEHKIESEPLLAERGFTKAVVKVFIPLGKSVELKEIIKEGVKGYFNMFSQRPNGYMIGKIPEGSIPNAPNIPNDQEVVDYMELLIQRSIASPSTMYVDVVFKNDCEACLSCHYEFKIQCTGHGGSAIPMEEQNVEKR